MKQVKCLALLVLNFRTHDHERLAWPISLTSAGYYVVTRAGALNESGALEVTCDRREDLEVRG